MRSKFRQLRVEQLERALATLPSAHNIPRPAKGWLRAIREATGITVSEAAKRMGRAPSLVIQQERAETDYRITLRSLREAADALGCQLVYALIPKNGSIHELAEERARTKATENVRAVEHSMALEDQAVGGVEKKIAAETKRILKRGRKK
jgi:predicted DNA-binding mobile mystery protein A